MVLCCWNPHICWVLISSKSPIKFHDWPHWGPRGRSPVRSLASAACSVPKASRRAPRSTGNICEAPCCCCGRRICETWWNIWYREMDHLQTWVQLKHQKWSEALLSGEFTKFKLAKVWVYSFKTSETNTVLISWIYQSKTGMVRDFISYPVVKREIRSHGHYINEEQRSY